MKFLRMGAGDGLHAVIPRLCRGAQLPFPARPAESEEEHRQHDQEEGVVLDPVEDAAGDETGGCDQRQHGGQGIEQDDHKQHADEAGDRRNAGFLGAAAAALRGARGGGPGRSGGGGVVLCDGKSAVLLQADPALQLLFLLAVPGGIPGVRDIFVFFPRVVMPGVSHTELLSLSLVALRFTVFNPSAGRGRRPRLLP